MVFTDRKKLRNRLARYRELLEGNDTQTLTEADFGVSDEEE